jgi:dTDP-4-dehydrorhamnose reductase
VTTLITGARGALGREFARSIPDALTPSSSELDIRDDRQVDAFIAANGVDTVVHCAARTAVRYCEENRADTLAVNVGGTRAVCDALTRHAASPRLLYISTACVFPGDDPDAYYGESDLPQPKNYYSLTKLLAEYVVSGWSACDPRRRALVVRTNFAERGGWKHAKAFSDRYGTYLYPDQIAVCATEMLDRSETGLVHICGDRRLSMLDFARLADPGVGETTLAEYDGPPVTVNMSLRSERA